MTKTVTRRPLTQSQQLALWKEHGMVCCGLCGNMCMQAEFHWDHHLAVVDGGAHDLDNIGPLCLLCHKRKSAREHKNNAKAKRVAKKHTNPLPPGTIKSRGFDKTLSRKMNGRVVPRNPASADNTGA